jgi:ubiquitin carboxyl-terminal hydrolase 8
MSDHNIARFININGVTCYMNSILTILQQMPIFTDFIMSKIYKDDLIIKSKNLSNTIIFQLYNLFEVSLSSDINIRPISFRQSISNKDSMWGTRQQQDSQEFLTFLLDCFDKELSNKVIFVPGRVLTLPLKLSRSNILIQILATNMWQRFIKNEYSLVKKLFTSMSRVTTKCCYCSNISNNFDIFQTLQLSIPTMDNSNSLQKFTLDDLMKFYMKEESIDKFNMIKCGLCNKMNCSIKQTTLWKTPKILIIHLKRFIVNNYGSITQKINNLVEYPIYNLDISEYIDIISPMSHASHNILKYNLFAVNLHHTNSNSIHSGHYTSIVKNRTNNKWYHYDDSNPVIEITKMNQLVNRNAYMLFYNMS